MGRFMSPDFNDIPDSIPYPDMDNPQTFNLYSYVQNNPLSRTDPDGHDCVVQTRTSDTTESVSVSSGNCDNVSVNTDQGQTKSYIAGTVDTSSIQGNNTGGITFGYAPYSGGGGVADLSGASLPDNPGIAYGYNQGGYNALGTAGATVGSVKGVAAFYGASALGGALAYGAGLTAGAELTTLGAETFRGTWTFRGT